MEPLEITTKFDINNPILIVSAALFVVLIVIFLIK